MSIQIGTAYYPEDWTREQIEKDAELMQRAGVHFVRMAEFAWSHMEIREGEYDFQWLHDAVEIFGTRGIRTVMCTPSSAAPAWMCRKYPEVLRMKRNGEPAWFGVRDHTCYTSRKYREFVLAMARKMAEEFRNDPRIYAWQIDNEPGCSRFPACFCPDCRKAFREYLKQKYGTLDALNKAWGATFWSGEFRDWEEIDLEDRYENMGSCRVLDSRIFRSNEMRDFVAIQARAVREIIPDALIGTNNYAWGDRYDGFQELDFAANDSYPSRPATWKDTTFGADIYRDLKPGAAPWVLETRVSGGWPRYDFDSLYFWMYVGHGNDHISYFQWNCHEAGNEKDHTTIIGTSGTPGPKYDKFCRLLQDARKLDGITLPQSAPRCAMVYDYKGMWNYSLGFPNRAGFYNDVLSQYHAALCNHGEPCAVISPDRDFSPYRLLILPVEPWISQDLADRLEKFTAGGGVLLMNGRSGKFDQFGKNIIGPGPDKVADLLGVAIEENQTVLPVDGSGDGFQIPDYSPAPEFAETHTLVHGCLGGSPADGTINVWACHLAVRQDTEVLMTFGASELEGEPFFTCRKHGRGYACYYASDAVDNQLMDRIIDHVKQLAGLTGFNLPENVDLSLRGNYLFLCNFNDHPVEFSAPFPVVKNVIGEAADGSVIRLEKYAAAVLEIRQPKK